eukprot:GHVS01038366.1.p1 GENE.GHVS01038366.1~~GHVS01038366.1.p1  ORF type:complete len:387 (+),score=63.09 GHVS01038366.1:174-1163(+)
MPPHMMYPMMAPTRGPQQMHQQMPQTAPHMIPAGYRSMGGQTASQSGGGPMYGRNDTMESLATSNYGLYKQQPELVQMMETKEKLGDVAEGQQGAAGQEGQRRFQQEKMGSAARGEVVERKIQVTRPVYREKIVEVPQIQYRDVPVEKIVEVPEVQTQVVIREIDVPQVIDVPVVQPRRSPVEQEIQRNIPMPIELRVSQGYEMPKLKPKYKEVPVPIYVPRYIEVPVPAQFVNAVQGTAPMASMTNGGGGIPGRLPSRMVTGASQQGAFQTGMMMPDQQRQQQSIPSRRQSSPLIIPVASRMPSGQGMPPPTSMSRQATIPGTPLVAA